MRVALKTSNPAGHGRTSAFNLVEAVIAMAICGIMFIALYSGISSSFFNVRLARENLRATQILLERMEVIRLCTWEQINSNGFVPTNFVAPLYPGSSDTNINAMFFGDIRIDPVLGPSDPRSASFAASAGVPGADLAAPYRNDLRIVTVTINWRTGGLLRTRRLSTYVSRFGIQNYVFN